MLLTGHYISPKKKKQSRMVQMKFQAVFPTLIAVWTSSLVAKVRSSDSVALAESYVSNIPNMQLDANKSIPLGKPDSVKINVPGPPLSPADFIAATNLVHEAIDISRVQDPIELAGLFEGDIALVNSEEIQDMVVGLIIDEESLTRNAITDPTKQWPNGIIPYIMSSLYNETERAIIATAMKSFESHTCIRFVPRSNESDYIAIVKEYGCSSSIGRKGGAQEVSLGPGCMYVGVVMHEFMHTVGFWHEQSRPDRDEYITINRPNIQIGMDVNFQKYGWDIIQSFGLDYDLGSITHYGPYAFSKDRSIPTIIPRTTGVEIGQRRAFSKTDILKLQKLYNCTISSEVDPETPITVQPTDGGCADHDGFCKLWSSMGECEKNPTWMNANCKRSCNQCEQECSDGSDHCEYWMKNGECHKNADYMSFYCKKSCRLCTSRSDYQGSICEDMNKYCRHWAKDNQCRTNPAYMLLWCRKSCKKC